MIIYPKRDKFYHLLLGLFTAILASVLLHEPKITWLVVLMAGIVKELYDSRTHEFDIMDIVATVAGGSVVMLFNF